VDRSPRERPSITGYKSNIYNGNPERNGLNLFSTTAATSKLSSLQPFNRFSGELRERPLDGEAKRAYDCYRLDTNCYGNRFPGDLLFGDLFLYHTDHILQFLEGDADYELPALVYLTTDEDFSFNSGAVAVALSNYRDGTQSMIIGTIPELWLKDYGVGPTSVMTHEAGHHLGLSHPHDGYDHEFNSSTGLARKVGYTCSSLCNLCVLCVSVVEYC
jgi:hypothetical protein